MTSHPPTDPVDVAVVGAGAAGLFAALGAAGALERASAGNGERAPRVCLLDGQARPGKKILISGGGRCNVTNARVSERDFHSEQPRVVRNVLREFPPDRVRDWLEQRGVLLAEEPLGKLFPVSGRASAVLGALLDAIRDAGIETRFGEAVRSIRRDGDLWILNDRLRARRVVVATGGRSIPKTGSAGWGYAFAEELGHRIVPTVSALVPLTGDADEELAGITLPVTLTVAARDGRVLARATGSLLFTHRGVSGPVALDVSHAVERARHDGVAFSVSADFWGAADPNGEFGPFLTDAKLPGACLPRAARPCEPNELERELVDLARSEPRTPLGRILERRLPRRLIRALVPDPATPLAHLDRGLRSQVARSVCAAELPVTGTEGFAKAEVTAGGIDLTEVDRRTFESRLAPGLHFAGEVLDATGRLGGFNFQWAWSSGAVAGRGAARALAAGI